MDPVDWSKLKTRCRGRLPHWELPGMTAFITFRTADALPRLVIDRDLAERRALDRLLAFDPDDPFLHRERARLFGHHIDRTLDAGAGRCPLKDPRLARVVEDTLKQRDGKDYLLHASVVMPNHVYLVATLAPDVSLAQVTQPWKSVTGHAATRDFGCVAPFWQEESYDHIVRHEGALRAVKRYVAENPKKAT